MSVVATKKICINCDAEVPNRAKFCNQCGQREFSNGDKCKFCSSLLPDKSSIKFCPNCGKRISTKQTKVRLIVAPEGTKHKCGICLLEINQDLTFCPSCIHSFHFSHIANWILEKNQCPICKTKLEFVD